jgi:hypothetical protein
VAERRKLVSLLRIRLCITISNLPLTMPALVWPPRLNIPHYICRWPCRFPRWGRLKVGVAVRHHGQSRRVTSYQLPVTSYQLPATRVQTNVGYHRDTYLRTSYFYIPCADRWFHYGVAGSKGKRMPRRRQKLIVANRDGGAGSKQTADDGDDHCP